MLWKPRIDRWSFGLGMLIGTMEGGVIMNLDGTLLLELPGPRVLIMMNARILMPPPSVGEVGMKGGVLAVIEVTPEHFMVGVLISWEVEKLIKIVIPVEAVFPCWFVKSFRFMNRSTMMYRLRRLVRTMRYERM